MSLLRPYGEWPLLLCGPMLRSVTPRSVSVFVALKEAHEVWLDIHLTPDPGSSIVYPLPAHGVAWTTTLGLGERLHVLCLTLTLPGTVSSLTSDWVYGYNLKFRRSSGAQELSLVEIDGNLLAGDYPLGYAPGLLPSFCLPPAKLENLNLVHGSCRKPHGEGRDMLAVLDDFIAQDREHFYLRPHQLFLTGDQIYADDVNLCLLRTLTETGKALLGWDEAMPNADGSHAFSLRDDWGGIWPRGGPGRAAFVGKAGAVGYTSEHLDGHLMFLAEFYAMYLMAWSDALWPREPSDQRIISLPTFSESSRGADWLGPQLISGFGNKFPEAESGRKAALVFASSLPKVRRALANVPTYMMFDDHEVTDDWNLNWEWVKRARSRAAGRRLLRNGLLAYAVFQDWGNRPGDYKSGGHGAPLLEWLAYAPAQAPAVHQNPEDDVLMRVLDLTPIPLDMPADVYQGQHLPDPALPVPPTRKRWDYFVDGPQHRVIVLDSRTWRAFPMTLAGKPENGAPALIAHHILPLQLQRHSNPDDVHNHVHIVVAPAPVIGLPVVEDVVQRIYARVSSPEAADLEAWGANRKTFELLLEQLAKFGRAILLSGDVHYAFSNHVAYFREPGSGRARLVQLCVSSLKNEDLKTRGVGLVGHWVTPHQAGWLGFEGDLLPLRAVARKGFSDLDWWMAVREAKHNFDRAYFKLVLRERFDAPAVIPSEGWGTDALIQMVQGLESNSRWRYRITYLRDDREKSVRQKEHTKLGLEHILEPTRAVVGFNNIGRISFGPDAAGNPVGSVIHRFYWYLPQMFFDPAWYAGLENELWFTEHVAPMTLPDDSERPEMTR